MLGVVPEVVEVCTASAGVGVGVEDLGEFGFESREATEDAHSLRVAALRVRTHSRAAFYGDALESPVFINVLSHVGGLPGHCIETLGQLRRRSL